MTDDAEAARRADAAAWLTKLHRARPGDPAAERARVAALNALGIPSAGPAEADWSTDLGTPTTTDMGAGNPRNGKSPWPATL